MKSLLCFIALLCIVPAFCVAPKPKAVEGSSCAICEFVVHELDSWIQTNATESEIEAVLEKVCTVVPKTVQPLCDEFVKEYTPELVELLVKKADPDTICHLIGLCTATPAVKASIECTVCHWIINELESYITSKSTEAEIVAAVEKVCTKLPGFVQQPCKDLVEEYGPQLIQMLVDQENPETICHQLGICKDSAAPVRGATECAICKWILVEIEKMITNTTTEEEIVKYVEGFCNKAPASLRQTCDAFVEEYGEMVIDMLIQRLDPTVVCQKLGLCTAVQAPEGTMECTVCRWAMKELDSLLEEGMVQAEIEHVLDKVCSLLPKAVQSMCDQLIDEYTPIIIQMILAKADPSTICAAIKLCPAAAPAPAVEAGFQCPVCEWVMTELDKLIEENATEAEIEKGLEVVCMKLPASVRGMCDDLVEEYTPVIIETLVNKAPPEKVCQLIGLCGKAVVAPQPVDGIECALCEWVMSTLEGLLKKNATETEIEAALDKVCGLLPKSITAQCDAFVDTWTPKIIELITEAVPTSAICAIIGMCAAEPVPENTVKCAVCEWVLTELDDLLEENATETDIEKALDKVCGFLPEALKETCDNFVDEYTPVVIELLVKEVAPERICTIIGLCGKGASVPAPRPVGDMKCATCEFVASALDDLLEENATETEIAKAIEHVCAFLPKELAPVCDQLIDEYTPILIQLFVQDVPAEKICTLIGLCGKAPKPAAAPVNPNGVQCAVCEWVLAELESLLEENSTEAEIEKALDIVCSKLPSSLTAMCDALVDQYTPLIIEQLVAHVAPDKVCTAIHLCAQAPRPAAPVAQPNDMQCVVCEWMMTDLVKIIGANATQGAIVDGLQKVCKMLPKSLRSTCNDLVQEDTPAILLALLVDRLAPEQVCAAIGLCGKPAVAEPNTIKCAVCEWVMAELDKLIEENATESEIEKGLEKVCMMLPESVRGMCNDLVEEYTPVIIELLVSKVPPEKVCAAIGLCGKSANIIYVHQQAAANIIYVHQVANANADYKCVVCEWAMQELDKLIEENSTETEIEHAVEKVCNKLPASIRAVCDELIEEYTPILIDLLVKDVPPELICSKMGLCSAAAAPAPQPRTVECGVCEWLMTEVDKLIEENATESAIESALEKVCGLLPKSVRAMCDGLIEAYTPEIIDMLVKDVPPEKICQALGLCGKAAPAAPVNPNGVECAVCEWVLAELDSLLEENTTETEIEKALDVVCSKLPSALTSMCDAFVDEYTPVLIELLVKQVAPDKICTIMHLCKAAPAPAAVGTVQCAVCEWVLTELDDLLEENATETEIEKALEKVCGFLPEALKLTCDTFVDEYTPVIIELLVKQVAPEKICTIIGLCGKSDAPAAAADFKCPICKFVIGELDDMLDGQRTKAAVEAALGKVCAKLPGMLQGACKTLVDEYAPVLIDMLVARMDPALICSKLSLCPATAALPQGQVECAVCEWVISELEALLQSNRTEEAIEAALEKVCSMLPHSVQDVCNDFVVAYGPTLIELLVKEADPAKVCNMIGLCTSAMTPAMPPTKAL